MRSMALAAELPQARCQQLVAARRHTLAGGLEQQGVPQERSQYNRFSPHGDTRQRR